MTEINKYQNGKIYKIVCNKTNLVYIGSTTEKYLCNRLKRHRLDYKKFLNNKHRNITSFKVLENNDYYIELVELYSCNFKDELLVRERYYFDIIDCVNKLRPMSTIEEKKELKKEYYIINKDKLNEQRKEYYIINKDKINERRKKYRDANKDKINERRKELYKLKKII
jgi:hypothetical protein